VFPAHDYKGDTVSTIGEEKRYNPRLQVGSVDEYVTLMNNLNLSNPKMMDVAVPANMRQGLVQQEIARRDIRDGDTVIIEKGGEIIPKVIGPVIVDGQPRSAPAPLLYRRHAGHVRGHAPDAGRHGHRRR